VIKIEVSLEGKSWEREKYVRVATRPSLCVFIFLCEIEKKQSSQSQKPWERLKEGVLFDSIILNKVSREGGILKISSAIQFNIGMQKRWRKQEDF